MKTILHVIESLGRGGAERVVINNVNLFDDYRHVICILHGPEDLKKELKKDVPVINLGVGKMQLLQAARKLRKVQKEYKIDLVHAHLLWSSWVARFGKVKSIPLVSTIHSNLSIDAFSRNRWSRSMEQMTAGKVDCMTGVSQMVLNDYAASIRYKGTLCRIYNYNALHNIRPASMVYQPGSLLKIICVGNVREAKNHAFLLRALTDLPEAIRAKVQIDIYGTGPLENTLKQEAIQTGLPINFMGSSDRIHEVYADYHLYCMCSKNEGMPMSLIEASDAGLPMLLSDIGIFRELAEENALFFGTDETETFNWHLSDIINGAEDLAALAKRSRTIGAKFDSEDNYVQQHYQVYSSLIKA